MLELAKHLTALDCKVKVGLPDKDATDVADWLDQDDKDAVEAKIQAMLQPYGAEMHPGYERFVELSADWDNLPDDGDPPPPILERTDGKTLLYANKLNGLFGQPGGGKSWLALLALSETVYPWRPGPVARLRGQARDVPRAGASTGVRASGTQRLPQVAPAHHHGRR